MEQYSRLPRRVAVTAAASVFLVAGAALAFAGSATADPVPPGPPEPADSAPPAPPAPDPALTPTTSFSNYVAGISGLGPELMLGQSPVPALPGTTTPAALPSADVLNAAQLLAPQNYRVPGPDVVSPYPLAQGVPGPFARVNEWQGLHAMVHGALGRMPGDQLGQPLPGTAPPPGVNIPAGPEQFLPDPAEAAPPTPGAPVPPPA
jgi:hypothetical protein